MSRIQSALAPLAIGLCMIGCNDRAVLLPNADATLNKSATSFSAEAAKRFPYPAQLPRGGELRARAEIGYMYNTLTLLNYSPQDFFNVELWVNKSYVLPLDTWEAGKIKKVAFKMIYDDQNQHLPLSGLVIQTLEVKIDGQLYTLPMQIGG